MMQHTKPIYLLADSQPLFTNQSDGTPLLAEIPSLFHPPSSVKSTPTLTAAYIGASNGDEPVFFELFEQAMQRLGIYDCHMIPATFSSEAKEILKKAHIILLAGGDPVAGWEVMQKAHIPRLLLERYNQGALLMGVSAGAMQLGWQIPHSQNSESGFIEGLKLAPFLISAHEDEPEWPMLQNMVSKSTSMSRGIGIPYGGVVIYHLEGEAEIKGNAATEIIYKEGRFVTSIIH
ncbi:Type 1 glutamine amidotransferase-like domain-containing protein [Roseivirga sp. BDSF3-8]|uniref:Type 1 glutamine amidotransferase-like domain-containing protein n=1 Tax=Roseivirga sp. BDSF3-8 TaxID=3241598 RepID=UPI0035320944